MTSYIAKYKYELIQKTNRHITMLDFDGQALNYADDEVKFCNIDYTAVAPNYNTIHSPNKFELLKHSKISPGEYWKFIPSDIKSSYDLGVCFSLHTVPIIYLVHTIYNTLNKCKEVFFCAPTQCINIGVMVPWQNLFDGLKSVDFIQETFDDGVFIKAWLDNGHK